MWSKIQCRLLNVGSQATCSSGYNDGARFPGQQRPQRTVKDGKTRTKCSSPIVSKKKDENKVHLTSTGYLLSLWTLTKHRMPTNTWGQSPPFKHSNTDDNFAKQCLPSKITLLPFLLLFLGIHNTQSKCKVFGKVLLFNQWVITL